MPRRLKLEFHALTPHRWSDLEALFGARGASGGCWCMWWRLARSQFAKQKGAANKKAFRKIVDAGPPPGVLAYTGGYPIAWCALAPREAYPVLERSRILKPIDDRPVWCVVCLFVARPFRRRGVSAKLLEAAAVYARKRGAAIVEGYPVDPKTIPYQTFLPGPVSRRHFAKPDSRKPRGDRKLAPSCAARSEVRSTADLPKIPKTCSAPSPPSRCRA